MHRTAVFIFTLLTFLSFIACTKKEKVLPKAPVPKNDTTVTAADSAAGIKGRPYPYTDTFSSIVYISYIRPDSIILKVNNFGPAQRSFSFVINNIALLKAGYTYYYKQKDQYDTYLFTLCTISSCTNLLYTAVNENTPVIACNYNQTVGCDEVSGYITYFANGYPVNYEP